MSRPVSLWGERLQVHDRDRAADREDRNRRVEPQLARMTFRSTGYCDEGAYFQTTLPRLAPGFGVVVGEQLLAPVTEKLVEELPIPGLVDPTRVRRARPVRNAAGADHRDALGPGVARTLERTAEIITALQRNQRRSLAVDV